MLADDGREPAQRVARRHEAAGALSDAGRINEPRRGYLTKVWIQSLAK
jgi:hypothetical protein